MAIKGSLKEASLADVCQLLALGQKTGCLSVTDRARFGQVFFDRGRITHAAIVNRRDRLGDLLVRDGALVPEQVRTIIAEQAKQPERRLGELLLEKGWIERTRLEDYIRLQVEEAVYSLFTWSRGSFFFEVDQELPAQEIRLSLNPESLLLEGARRVDEWGLIEKKIPSLDLLFDVEQGRLAASDVELTAEQKQLLPLLDGARTVQDLIDQTDLSEFDVGKALYGLIQAGFAHRVGQRAAPEAGRVRGAKVMEHRNLGVAFYRAGLLEESARAFRHVLELEPGDDGARFSLALIAVREGEDREALREFKALLERRGPTYAAFANLGFVLNRLGRAEDALLVLGEAGSLKADGEATALLESMIRLERLDLDAAHRSLERYRAHLSRGGAPTALAFHQEAIALALTGRLGEAESKVLEGIERYPTSAPLLVLAGAIAERRGELPLAEKRYRQAAEEDPTLAQAHKNLGDVAYRRALYDEALDHYSRAVQLAPALGDDVYARLGNLHYRRREQGRAIECWQAALRLNPANSVVRHNLEAAGHG